jgi:hypothetical protein
MAMRMVLAGAITLVAAGAAVGAVLATGHGAVWAAVGGSITGVTAVIATFWWEAARDKRNSPESPAGEGAHIKVVQHVRRIGRDSHVVGIVARLLPTTSAMVKQKLGKVGPGSTIIGLNDPGKQDKQ